MEQSSSQCSHFLCHSHSSARCQKNEDDDDQPENSHLTTINIWGHYYWKVIADGAGQRRVSVVLAAVNPPARSVQHSPSVEE